MPTTTKEALANAGGALINENPEAAKLRSRVSEIRPGELFIDGKFRPAQSGKTRDNIDPSTERVTTRVAEGSEADIQEAVKAARQAFENGPWSRMNPFDRGQLLQRVATAMLERADEFAIRETVDVGKPITPTRSFDVPQGAGSFAYYGALAGQLDGATRPGNGSSMVYTRREPVGVVGAISPFNFPLNLSINKIAPALAAGNTVVHKPAAETPLRRCSLLRSSKTRVSRMACTTWSPALVQMREQQSRPVRASTRSRSQDPLRSERRLRK